MKHILFIAFMFCAALCQAQSLSVSGKVEDTGGEAVPFANVALFVYPDTATLVGGCATDLGGVFRLDSVPAGEYMLQVSYVGYATENVVVSLSGKDVVQNVVLAAQRISLGEVVVEGSRSTRGIDRTSYTFDENQIKKAHRLHDLVATLPNLHVDRTTNSLAAVNGKSVMILLNGVKASDEDLRLIPADKIKNVEYYDVPPMRYMNDAEIVVNVRTRPLDTGWSGSIYATAGQMFSGGSASLSYVKGDNRLTVSYIPHINMKRNVKDREVSRYIYSAGGEDYRYDYTGSDCSWGDQHAVEVTYSNSRENNYDFQLKAAASVMNDNTAAEKDISFSRDGVAEQRTGGLDDKTRTVSPSLDIYFSKQVAENGTFTIDLLGSYFGNEQHTRSHESGPSGFDDDMLLDNDKKSLIGEAVYTHRFAWGDLTAGYRGHFNFLSNRLSNSLSQGTVSEDINTMKHYLYGDLSGRVKSFMYRISLGGNFDSRSGDGGFRNLTFTPVVMAGYDFGKAGSLRLSYNSETLMPDIQQMSDARILIMNNFYRTGNRNLENAHRQELGLHYDFSARGVSLRPSMFYEYTTNSLFNSYVYDDGCVLLQTGNADMDVRRGFSLDLNYTPWEFLRIGGSVEAAQYLFRTSAGAETYRCWSWPATLYLSVFYKKFSFDYYQKFGGSFLSGLYRTGIEKVSYLSLGYSYRNLFFGLQCFFPFIKDKVTNETVSGSVVYHKTDIHMKRKDHTFALSVSWHFNKGRDKAPVLKNVENYDGDRGVFRVK